MGADLNNIVKCQKLTDDHVQFLIYQILRGLKVSQQWGNSHLVIAKKKQHPEVTIAIFCFCFPPHSTSILQTSSTE